MNADETRLSIPITNIETESPSVKTISFDSPIVSQPGQFVMVTDFEHGEKPFSPSRSDNSGFSLTVRAIGPFTRALCDALVGDIISVRGAFGSSFFIPDGNDTPSCIVIGGGCGTPPLFHLTNALVSAGSKVTVINGAKTADEVLFSSKFSELEVELYEVSEDGVLPLSGTTVEVAADLLEKSTFDYAYVAGPELMMKALLPLMKGSELKSQFLLERYMKCGIGICGSCAMDPSGFRVCVEGPVVDSHVLASLSEFGNYHRDASGQIEGIGGCVWNA